MCVCVCVCVCVCDHFLCTLIQYLGFMGDFFMLSWMFLHDYLDTCCFECLIICMCFVFLYLHLLNAIKRVSHGKVL